VFLNDNNEDPFSDLGKVKLKNTDEKSQILQIYKEIEQKRIPMHSEFLKILNGFDNSEKQFNQAMVEYANMNQNISHHYKTF